MVKTLFVNLYGGPGTGKSTTAAEVFAKLKRRNLNVELIQEYAKDRVWSRDFKTLGNQLYVTAKQVNRQVKLEGEVDVAISDSPVLLGALAYAGFGATPGFKPYMLEVHSLFWNLDCFLRRDRATHPYNPKGRSQTEDEAVELDRVIARALHDNHINFSLVDAGDDAADKIVKLIDLKLDNRC